MDEEVECAEALSALADITTAIALMNYQSEEVARMVIGRMERNIADWRAQHLLDGDLNQIC
jgi:hypothetical protein